MLKNLLFHVKPKLYYAHNGTPQKWNNYALDI